EAQAWGEMVILRTWTSVAGSSQNIRAINLHAVCRPDAGEAVHRGNIDPGAAIEATKLGPIEALRVWSAPFITQSQVKCQAASHFPVVLNEEGGLCRPVGHRRRFSNTTGATAVTPADQQRGQAVALVRIGEKHVLPGHVLAKRQSAAGVTGLEK